MRQLQKLNPGCTITITPAEVAWPPRGWPARAHCPRPWSPDRLSLPPNPRRHPRPWPTSPAGVRCRAPSGDPVSCQP